MVLGADGDSKMDEETNTYVACHELIQNRMNIQNNVIMRRKEQLKAWETSEMNKLPAVRKPPCTAKVKFQESDIFFSACVSGDEDEVEDLLSNHGANVNAATIDGVTALHQAVIDGKVEMVRFLCSHGADINAQDNEGWTPLHAAVCCGNIIIVKYLVEKGADFSITNSDKELPVDLAEDDEIRTFLDSRLQMKGLNAEQCRDREQQTMMSDCLEWIRSGSYLDRPHPRTGATALHVAASKGYNKLIALLVQAGADVKARDFEGWTPLHAAAHWGELDACRILISRGADISAQTLTGQDVLRVADVGIAEDLERMARELAEKLPDGSVSVSATVLQPTDNTPSANKRTAIIRMNSDEKETIKKKDEHDENVSLNIKLPTVRSASSPLPTVVNDHSLSPPPSKRVNDSPSSVMVANDNNNITPKAPPTVPPRLPISQPKPAEESEEEEEEEDEEDEEEAEEEEEDEEEEETAESEESKREPTPVTSTTLYLPTSYQVPGLNRVKAEEKSGSREGSAETASSSTPSVQAVLPAPRQFGSEASGSSVTASTESGVTSSSGSTALSGSHSSESKSSAGSAFVANNVRIRPSEPNNDKTVRKPPSATNSRVGDSAERYEEEEEEEQSAATVGSNTSSSISSIQTRSRSVTPKDASSSLYSSDQNVGITLRRHQQPPKAAPPPPPSVSSETSTTKSENRTNAAAVAGTLPANITKPTQQQWKEAPLARLTSPSSESSAESSSVMYRRPLNDGSKFAAVPQSSLIQRLNSHLTTPTIASTHRQRPPMSRSASVVTDRHPPVLPATSAAAASSNAPWVNHWRSPHGAIHVGRNHANSPSVPPPPVASRTTSAASNNSTSTDGTTPASSPAPGFFRPSQPIQPTIAYKKYSAQLRSWQTPPQQPAPQKESEAERKAKSRLQRASRRSTQGVTLDQLTEARAVNGGQSTPANIPNEDIGKWKSSTLQQQQKVVSHSNGHSESESSSLSERRPPLKITVPTALSAIDSPQTTPTLAASDTPSAAKMNRRSAILRANRRGTGPVDMEALQTAVHMNADPKMVSESFDDGDDEATDEEREEEDLGPYEEDDEALGVGVEAALPDASDDSAPTSTTTTSIRRIGVISSVPWRREAALLAEANTTDRQPTKRTNSLSAEESHSDSPAAPKPPSRRPKEEPKRMWVIGRVTVRSAAEQKSSEPENPTSPPNSRVPKIEPTLPPAFSTSGALPQTKTQNGIHSTPVKFATSNPPSADYKALYERACGENERLKKEIESMRSNRPLTQPLSNGSAVSTPIRRPFTVAGAHSPTPPSGHSITTSTVSSSSSSAPPPLPPHGTLDDSERRAFERRIAELESELQKVKPMQSDNKRLKDENNALIRVISKLSKDYPRTPSAVVAPLSTSMSSTSAPNMTKTT